MKKLTRREMLKLMGYGIGGAALAACSPGADEPAAEEPAADQPSADEPKPTDMPPKADPTVVTFVESWMGIPQFADSIAPVTAAISAKMQSEGLNIELRSLVLDNHKEKYPTLYAAGADFTCAFDAPWRFMTSMKDQGFLVELEGLLEEYGPKVIESCGKEIVDFNMEQGPDGETHLYGIPARFYYAGTTGVVIREDLREKYGAAAPDPAKGYYSVEPYLQAIKDNEPGMIPFVNRTRTPMAQTIGWNRVTKAFGGVMGIGLENEYETTEITDLEDWKSMQEAALLGRDWYEKGFFPQESLAPDFDVITDYMATGKGALAKDQEPGLKWYEYEKIVQGGIPDARLMGYDVTGMRAGLKGTGALKQWNFVTFNAGAPEEQQVAGVQAWNWFCSSQENADMWLMGIEGENYKAEAGNTFSEIEGVDQATNYRRQWFVSGITGEFQRQAADLPQECLDALAYYTTKENFSFTPYEKFSVSNKEIETQIASIKAIEAEANYGIASGSVPVEEAWATYEKMLDDAGRQEVKAWYQEKFDAWLAENKDFVDSFPTNYDGADKAAHYEALDK